MQTFRHDKKARRLKAGPRAGGHGAGWPKTSMCSKSENAFGGYGGVSPPRCARTDSRTKTSPSFATRAAGLQRAISTARLGTLREPSGRMSRQAATPACASCRVPRTKAPQERTAGRPDGSRFHGPLGTQIGRLDAELSAYTTHRLHTVCHSSLPGRASSKSKTPKPLYCLALRRLRQAVRQSGGRPCLPAGRLLARRWLPRTWAAAYAPPATVAALAGRSAVCRRCWVCLGNTAQAPFRSPK